MARREGALSAVAGVVAAVAMAAPAGAAIVGQGGVRMGADVLWSEGVLGQGQTVAILDEGFAGLDRSIALGELPRDALTIRAFDPLGGEGGFTEFGIPTQHGVRMAELVHDLAPQARLVLVGYRTLDQFEEAAAWITARHPDRQPLQLLPDPSVRRHRTGGPRGRRGDRCGGALGQLRRQLRAAALARTAGPEGAVIPIAPTLGRRCCSAWRGRRPPRGRASRWSASTRRAPGPRCSAAPPAGPTHATTTPLTAGAGSWRLVVRQEAGPQAELTLFSQTAGFGPLAVAAGSIPTPGDAAGALSVGAVKWTGTALEPYSSQGLTDDGRAKPDLVGPVYVTSNPEWPGTAGTSAATAHVAGAAVLLRQARLAAGQPAGAADLRAVLDRGRPRPRRPGPRPALRSGHGPARHLPAADRGARHLRPATGRAGCARRTTVRSGSCASP